MRVGVGQDAGVGIGHVFTRLLGKAKEELLLRSETVQTVIRDRLVS
jgi:hypothetical protein